MANFRGYNARDQAGERNLILRVTRRWRVADRFMLPTVAVGVTHGQFITLLTGRHVLYTPNLSVSTPASFVAARHLNRFQPEKNVPVTEVNVIFWPHRARAGSAENHRSHKQLRDENHIDNKPEKDEVLRPGRVFCFRSTLDLDGESREGNGGTCMARVVIGLCGYSTFELVLHVRNPGLENFVRSHDTSIKALGKHEKVWTQESCESAGARPKPELPELALYDLSPKLCVRRSTIEDATLARLRVIAANQRTLTNREFAIQANEERTEHVSCRARNLGVIRTAWRACVAGWYVPCTTAPSLRVSDVLQVIKWREEDACIVRVRVRRGVGYIRGSRTCAALDVRLLQEKELALPSLLLLPLRVLPRVRSGCGSGTTSSENGLQIELSGECGVGSAQGSAAEELLDMVRVAIWGWGGRLPNNGMRESSTSLRET
ncbi:hypothetical protein BJV77DRAFT_963964 [Russula vinacea]|nr:hypothetical protein BJV77DRAFT_963964 [Russula vinacea]